ncbi:MAG TPA: hypothetical protein VLT33_01620, partial [Labilithrix sp.]|nr:hypothetical protein [Labilithrix sp.]
PERVLPQALSIGPVRVSRSGAHLARRDEKSEKSAKGAKVSRLDSQPYPPGLSEIADAISLMEVLPSDL